MIDLSIVIPSYEAADCLGDCLASIEQARRAHPEIAIEVILVDNGSREACVAVARGSALQPRVIAWLRNRGFAAAVNAGLRTRRGRHALLLNSDVRIDPNLLARAIEILDREPSIGVLGPALFHSDGRPQRSVHPQPDLSTELLPEPVLRWLRPA
jgi:GT2 family glycosyltransferase